MFRSQLKIFLTLLNILEHVSITFEDLFDMFVHLWACFGDYWRYFWHYCASLSMFRSLLNIFWALLNIFEHASVTIEYLLGTIEHLWPCRSLLKIFSFRYDWWTGTSWFQCRKMQRGGGHPTLEDIPSTVSLLDSAECLKYTQLSQLRVLHEPLHGTEPSGTPALRAHSSIVCRHAI